MTFENSTFYRIELPQMCPQSEIRNQDFPLESRFILVNKKKKTIKKIFILR